MSRLPAVRAIAAAGEPDAKNQMNPDQPLSPDALRETIRQLTTERAALHKQLAMDALTMAGKIVAIGEERDEWNRIAQERAVETSKWHKNSKDLESILHLAGEQAEIRMLRITAERDAATAKLATARTALEAADRMLTPKYHPWTNAGGPDECEHGYNRNFKCPACDLALLRAALNETKPTIV